MSDPQQRDLLIERLHVLIAETRRCIDDHRLVRADDKLNAMDENCELLQAEIVRLRAEKDAAESALHGLRESICSADAPETAPSEITRTTEKT
jgi:hypothetical protein